MPNVKVAIICLISSAVLTACSPSATTGHPVCKNEATTQEYGVKWMDDLADASQSGQLPMAKVAEIHGDSFSKLGLLKERRFVEYCDHLDEVRKSAGF